jgi:eukaryotic-like serine/threonine-protein kinase
MGMDARRWERAQRLFHAALELPATERSAYLEGECADDAALVSEVMALLEEDARAGATLEPDVARLASAVLDGSVPGVRVIGPYRILRVLGHGGMGVVYLAERDDLGSRVAIKVLRDAALSPVRRERFEREQQTLAQLNHPSIARLYDADTLPDGTPYFVMEYVEGMPITEYCDTAGVSIADRLRLFRDVCVAVQHAHRHAVVHRDLKPSNILVTANGGDGAGDGQVKLLDFGIAKQLERLDSPAQQTQTGLRLMTPAYAAPEQVRGEPVGVHTDVYSLGAVLYQMLTGVPPFDLSGRTPAEVETMIVTAEPERPSIRWGRADCRSPGGPRVRDRRQGKDLDVLCLTAMHKDPQRRYPTVEALIRDLDHFRREEPLEARADTVRYRAGKFVRRNRRQVTAAALLAAVLMGLVGFHTVRLAEQRDRAQMSAAKAERISEYLIGLFEAGDPYAAGPANLDVQTLLERGERRAWELTEQPELQAAMLNVLGRVHTQLSDYERAALLLERALELRRERGEAVDIAESLTSLASLYVDQGDYDGAEAALREALTLRERHLPGNDPALASNLSDLGTVLGYKGQYQDAEALHRMAVRIRRTSHGGPHEELGFSLNRLAVSLFQQGNYDEAERTYREALAVSLTVFGPEHASVTRVLANLGKLYEELGNYTVADSLLTEALRIRRATLGDDHFETAVGLGQLASLRTLMGDPEGAERYLRESLAIRERILAPTHPSIGTIANNLALTLEHQGEYGEAEALYRRAVDIYAESLGERHRFTGVALSNVANILFLQGDLEAAHDHYLQALGILHEAHPENHQELAHNRSRFGAVLAARARYEEAEPLLLDAYGTLSAQLGPDHTRTRQAAERIVALYEAWERHERAMPYREALAAGGEGSR